jgi:hypothetical protein
MSLIQALEMVLLFNDSFAMNLSDAVRKEGVRNPNQTASSLYQ